MRVMVLVKASKETEAAVPPDEKILTEMGKFNEELVKAGVMLAGEGLHPSSRGARVRFSGAKRTVASPARSAPSSTGPSRRRRSWSPASGSGR